MELVGSWVIGTILLRVVSKIKNDVTFQGMMFWYDSAGTTTILPFSQLTIGDDLTFLIGKKTYGAQVQLPLLMTPLLLV